MAQPQPTHALPSGVDQIRRVATTVLTYDAPFPDDPLAWLEREGRSAPHLAALIDGLAQRLRRTGVPVVRISIHIGTVHPQLLGYGCVWNHRGGHCKEFEVRHAAIDAGSFKRGPLRPVIEDGLVVRRDPRLPEARAEFALMADLHEEGITDYIARPLGAIGRAHIAVTYSTDAAQRFAPEDLARIERTLPILLLHLDLRIMSSIASNVLDAYVGRRAGARVLRGEVLRGEGEHVDAVIWVSDLRNFTGLSDRLPDAEMIGLLNAYFERMVGAILEHGGEVLKFIGDGLLAIFPVDPAAPEAAAESAIHAGKAALAALAGLNETTGKSPGFAGDWGPLGTGIALHRGHVFFGNIGAPARVDFTVIGTAVNLAARVEPLTKTLGHSLLLTDAVAKLTQQSLVALGTHPLRGLATPVRLFAPAKSDSGSARLA